uniref:Ring finger protein 123 n=1 Tax=Hucho hucho TaxID=62062 RepID=A0A4W5KCQ4_9TELE
MQIGWCTLNCRFNQEEGVGDTPDSYAYDGNRVRKWNVTTTNYGKSWAAGDIVSCLIDLDEGTITFCLNGQSLGTAFSNIKMGPGIAYFPAISLSFKESVAFNFGSRPLRYPVEGYLPLQNPPTADLLRAHKLLGYIKTVLSTTLDTQEEKVLEKDSACWSLHGEPTTLVTLAHIFNYFAPLMCKVYLVEDVLMNFLLGILEGGGSVDEHPLIQQLLDLFWLLMEDYEVNECLKQLMMSLLRAYRFSPIIPDLGFQIHYLRLTTAILRHEKSRKYLLSNVLYPFIVVFFYIKTPLRVKEAGLEELIPTTWWPTRFDKEGKESKDESAEERLRRRAYERGCQRLKKRIEVVEELQVQILKLMLNNKDKGTGEASRYIFLNKFRKFLQENASNRGHPTALCPPEYMVCFLHRLITAVRSYWDEGKMRNPGCVSSDEAYVPPQLFYNGKVDYFDLQRLGGLLSHLKKTLKGLKQHDCPLLLIRKCIEDVVPTVMVTTYPIPKPWIDGRIHTKLKARTTAFNHGKVTGNMNEYQQSNYILRKAIKEAKRLYRDKVESHFNDSDTRRIWQRPQPIAHYKDCEISFSVADMSKTFKRVNPCKAAGPDGIPSRILRACADQLAGVFMDIFNLSLSQSAVPTCFKMSTIVPVPKKAKVTELNDYRPRSIHFCHHEVL